MKILHINSYYGGGMFYKNLYDIQKDNGLEINVYVPTSTATNFSNLDLGDYTTTSINHSKYDRIFFHVKHNKILKDVVEKYAINEYSIIHAHSLFSNGYIALRLKEKFDIPYIVAVRNTDVNTFFKYMFLLRKLGVQILKKAEKIIFLSESYRDFVVEKYVPEKFKKEIIDKTVIIPNGIDHMWLHNKGNMKDCPNHENLRLIYAGVINKNKNLVTTVKAIEELQKLGYKVDFTIVGRVDDKSIFKEIIKVPFVNYIDPKPKEELINIYRNNDIFVMPSIHETFGLVYAEAMSQGLPVIYTKGQGFDRQFENGLIGYSVDWFNAKEIADKIVDIMNNYEKTSNNCLKYCEKFNWNLIANEYMDIYEVCSFTNLNDYKM